MYHSQCMTRKPAYEFPLRQSSNSSAYDDSWVEQAFAEDSARVLGGCVWPPRSYSCAFCGREFRSAQALGGHMNVHRRDRARQKQSSSPPIDTEPRNPYHFLSPLSSADPMFPFPCVSPSSPPSRASTTANQDMNKNKITLNSASTAEDDMCWNRCSNNQAGDRTLPPHNMACLAKTEFCLKKRKLVHDLPVLVGSCQTTLDPHPHPCSIKELDLELRLGFAQPEVQ